MITARIAFYAAWLCLYIVAAWFYMARPASASDSTMTPYHDPGPNDAWFARIEVWNEPGSTSFERTLETDRGPVVVRYTTLAGTSDQIEDADRVEVISTPQGIVAVPRIVQATEGQFSNIYLFEFVGA